MIVLAAKLCQEHVDIIEYLIYLMCFSYKKTNSIKGKKFAFPITRCNDTIDIIGSGSNEIWIIILSACQGYHQVAVKKSDRDKLYFLSPNNSKYCFNVIRFYPTNKPLFYTDTMKELKYKWYKLFCIWVEKLERTRNNSV